MTQEQKSKLKQLAKAEIDNSVWSNHDDSLPLNVAKNALVRFAQTILENPGEWGLKEASQTWFKMVDELTKYREALEKIERTEVSDLDKFRPERFWKIAKEALKQHDNETDNTGNQSKDICSLLGSEDTKV